MDHKALISSLSAETRAALTERSDAAGLRHLAGYLAAIAVTGLWIGFGGPLWWAMLLPHGLLLTFLFTLEHECTHQTPFKTPLLNEVVGRLAGLVLILPFQWFRFFHMAHHRHTNDPERDPELAESGRPETFRDFAIYLSGFRYWRAVLRTLMTNAMRPADAPYIPAGRKRVLAWEARGMIFIYTALLYAFPVQLFWLWLLPLLLGQPFLRLYLLAEHGHCPAVANMFENTRTTFTNRLVRALAWNMPYHAEHHAHPAVPFHKLPEFHAVARDHLQRVSKGYTAFSVEYARRLEH